MKLLPPPGPERRRQLTWLAVASAALAAVLWYQLAPAGAPVPASNVAAESGRAAPAPRLPDPVRLADLDHVPEAIEVRRNPFSFGSRPVAAEPEIRYTPPPIDYTPAATLPAGPPPIALRLTGLLIGPGSERALVTLKDPASGALFHAYEGDVVDGRYRIVKVGAQSVVVSYVDGSGTRTLGLGQ